MKKHIFFFFLVLSAYQMYAQELYYGPKVGINANNLFISGDDELNDSKFMLSSHIGGFVEIVFSDFFSIQPELLYTVKGARFKLEGDDAYKSAYVFKYISIPIMFKYFVTENISIEAGPQVAYLLSAENVEVSGIFSSNTGTEAAAINLYEDMNHLDFGVSGGVGFISNNGFYVSARYEYGLMDVSKNHGEINDIIKNGTIMLSAGFSFR